MIPFPDWQAGPVRPPRRAGRRLPLPHGPLQPRGRAAHQQGEGLGQLHCLSTERGLQEIRAGETR